MKRLYIFLVLTLLFCVFYFSAITIFATIDINSYEEEKGIEYIGAYEIFTTKSEYVKVYLTNETKAIYDANNWEYYTEIVPRKFLGRTIWTHTYYYIYEQRYVNSVSERITLKNDINSLIYIVAKLEEKAYDYLYEHDDLTMDDEVNNVKITNLVLGYIRSFNINYGYSDILNSILWTDICGGIDEDYITCVNENDTSPFKIRDYFAYFCEYNNFNYELHMIDGEQISTINERIKGGKLLDPINDRLYYNEIDLIHMFATIDGTYAYTGFVPIGMQGSFQRDLSGWAGDLQTFCKRDVDDYDDVILYKENYGLGNSIYNNPNQLISYIHYDKNGDNIEDDNVGEGNFSNSDMLGDIDAMNIVKLFLDGGDGDYPFNGLYNNLLSASISAYYNFVENDNANENNRYQLFIESVAVDNYFNPGNDFEKFREKVYISMNLVQTNNGFEDKYFITENSIAYHLLVSSNVSSSVPSLANRVYVAELFIDYIYDMSTPPIIVYSSTVEVNCYSNTFEEYVLLDDNEIIRYPVNVLCNSTYKLKASAQTNEIITKIYNDDGTLYTDESYVSMNGTTNTFILNLDAGSYYLELYFADESDGWEIEVEIGPYIQDLRREIILNETTDVLSHLHDGISRYKFMRSNGDYYNMEIVMQSYDTNINPTCEVELFNTYTNDSFIYILGSGEPRNNTYIYNIAFEADSYYMINIDFSSTDLMLSSCTAKITYLEEVTLDTLGSYMYDEDIIIGDKITRWTVAQNANYEITIEGDELENVVFVILKKSGNGFISLDCELASGLYYYVDDFEFNQGDEIYIGYLGGNGVGEYTFTIERAISNDFHLVTDIDSLHTVGSEVRLNNGSYGGTTIMQGFTRVCYLDVDCPYPSTRLNYNWYSSDETIAKVSSFGTVTATCLWQDNAMSKQVTISAVYKYDYTVVGTIVLTVYKDDSSIIDFTYLQYGMDVREDGTISGTEVTSGLGNVINVSYNPTVTIHSNRTRLICLGLDSPTSSIQDYIWTSSNDYYAQVSSFGTIFANHSGIVTISGVNKYNSRYRVSITITII